jgi:hypothetical protein
MKKRRPSRDEGEALQVLTDAAEGFVNGSPRVKRLEPQRQALLDAIRLSQLVLSVKRQPRDTDSDVPSLTEHRARQPRFRKSASRHMNVTARRS